MEAGHCEVVERNNATVDAVFDVLQDPRYRDRVAVFHYGGHAGPAELVLETPAGGTELAHAGGLAAFLGEQRGVQRGDESEVTSAAFSPDGARVVTVDDGNNVRVWAADGSGEPVILSGHGDAVNVAAWSSDGSRIATASDDATARVWQADGSGEPVVLRGHEGPVRGVSFSRDGQRVATAGDERYGARVGGRWLRRLRNPAPSRRRAGCPLQP